ncbi:MAG TPA: helicase-related protein, partial [Actinomycetota bacterium]|nr:helicase-related protein [Actinomycetota bacterium]
MTAQLRPGAVIRLRERLWRVDRVGETEFAATPLDGRDTYPRRFLRSLEEPDVRPGALPPPDPGSPGDPAEQDLLLRAYRLSLIHGSAPFLGLQRSRAIPEPYQLVPLLMALGRDRVRLLIGDDVGIGKTIEAGLILAELVARGVVDRALIVVPASLREQWQEALQHFFHIDAVIVAGYLRPALERRLLPGQSPWEAFPFVVVSIDYAKKHPGEILAARWDAAIVDECHIAARPHQAAGRGEEMQRYEFLARLARRVDHLILLSATPHNGYTDSFASLVAALNPAAVSDGRVVRDVARRHIVQRRRKDIEEWYGDRRLFPKRDPWEPVIPISPAERDLFVRLRAYTDRIEARGPQAIHFWVAAHLQKRALSSPAALRASLANRRDTILQAIAKRLQPPPDPTAAEAGAVVTDVPAGDDRTDEERSRRLDAAAVRPEELDELEELERLARALGPGRDSKLRYLCREVLPRRLSAHPRSRRVLVFTKYKDTLDYLSAQLARERTKAGALQGIEVFEIHGDLPQAERRRVFRAFERTDRAVCLATDAISEGLDLQRACAEIVHYELPWNPNRLEQRNGRIDRYGQPEPTVGITTLVLDDPLDVAMLEVIERKARAIRDEFGFCPVYLSSGRDLRDLMRRYGSRQLALFGDPAADDEELPDPFDRARIERIQEESFYGQQELRLPEVEEALRRTHETVGSPEEIEGFVRSALARFGGALEPTGDGSFLARLEERRLAELDPEGQGLAVTFSPELGRDDPELEVLDLAHPLVRRLIDLVREDAAGTQRGRFAARATPAASEVTAVVHVLARYVAASDP